MVARVFFFLVPLVITLGRLVVRTIEKPGRSSPVQSRTAFSALLEFSLIFFFLRETSETCDEHRQKRCVVVLEQGSTGWDL